MLGESILRVNHQACNASRAEKHTEGAGVERGGTVSFLFQTLAPFCSLFAGFQILDLGLDLEKSDTSLSRLKLLVEDDSSLRGSRSASEVRDCKGPPCTCQLMLSGAGVLAFMRTNVSFQNKGRDNLFP